MIPVMAPILATPEHTPTNPVLKDRAYILDLRIQEFVPLKKLCIQPSIVQGNFSLVLLIYITKKLLNLLRRV